jgi:hypothetical protein
MSFFSGNSAPDPAITGQVKEWVRQSFHLPPEATVMVTELRCSEPGCPPLETVIAILEGPGHRRQAKVHCPVAEITEQDVTRLQFC